LRAQYQTLRDELLPEIDALLSDSEIVLGPRTRSFEDEFAAYCGVQHCVALDNGTSALHLALRACEIGQGDEVITVPNTFVATVEAIQLAGAQAVLVDVDPRIGNLDPARLEEAITPMTRAVLPVHLHGHPAEMNPIVDLARRYGLRVIEDACQAHGAEYQGRRVGSLADIACFSFYCSKNLGAFGEAGAVVTDDAELADRVRLLRNHSSSEKYRHSNFGLNGRPDELQCSVLRLKLPYLDAWNERRMQLAQRYTAALAGLDLELPSMADWARPVFHIYAMRTPHRDELLTWLRARGVQAAIHYPVPIHFQPAYGHLKTAHSGLQTAERWCRETLSLPMYPELSQDDLEYVADMARDFFASKGGTSELNNSQSGAAS
jgi:dTDP-4-amino-4,6-dideoxygalactose transaminase